MDDTDQPPPPPRHRKWYKRRQDTGATASSRHRAWYKQGLGAGASGPSSSPTLTSCSVLHGKGIPWQRARSNTTRVSCRRQDTGHGPSGTMAQVRRRHAAGRHLLSAQRYAAHMHREEGGSRTARVSRRLQQDAARGARDDQAQVRRNHVTGPHLLAVRRASEAHTVT